MNEINYLKAVQNHYDILERDWQKSLEESDENDKDIEEWFLKKNIENSHLNDES